MEFKCSLCDYQSERKDHVKTHLHNKNPCGEGIAEILEIPVEIKCTHCNKKFSTKPNLKRHLKNCKIKKNTVTNIIATKVEQLEKQLEEVNKKLTENQLAVASSTTINTQTQNNLINNQNNLSIVIQLRPYDDPKMADDMDDIFEDAWSKMKSIPTFIERLHLSDELPENNNMCITNLRTNLAKVFDGQSWVTKDQDTFLDEVIARTNLLMDKWVRGKPSRKEYENDFNEYLDTIGGRNKFNEDTRRDLKLILYDTFKNGMVNIKSGTKKQVKYED